MIPGTLTRAQSARSLAEHAWTTATVESRPEVAAEDEQRAFGEAS